MYRVGVDDSELYDVVNDSWQMTNLGADPSRAPIREELRRTLLDWLLRTTRYHNTWPHLPKGADDKSNPAEIEAHISKGGAWTGAQRSGVAFGYSTVTDYTGRRYSAPLRG